VGEWGDWPRFRVGMGASRFRTASPGMKDTKLLVCENLLSLTFLCEFSKKIHSDFVVYQFCFNYFIYDCIFLYFQNSLRAATVIKNNRSFISIDSVN